MLGDRKKESPAIRPASRDGSPAEESQGRTVPSKPQKGSFPMVAIGASAGGLEAFEGFFRAMPPASGMAFILVAHLDPTHVSILPELVQRTTKMKVHSIQDSMVVEPDAVYVIPPNKDLRILNGVLHLFDLQQPRSANLPIDSFFRSLAQDQGAAAVAIILSGTGTDGTLGLKAIKGELGMVMVQDEESATYDGMPRSALATNLADYVLPPGKMPAQLIRYTQHSVQPTIGQNVPAQGEGPESLQKIFIILRSQTNHDFSLYKKNTIIRRIERRMNVHQIVELSDYMRYLQESEREVGILFKELLIGVTNFFRDPEAFDHLKKDALGKLLGDKPNDYTVRVWVPGCSSGEEAYSVAILLYELMEESKLHFNVQIFGTDIDEDAIAVARAGIFPASLEVDVGAERLRRFFSLEDDGRYRIRKIIRDMLVFAPQNLISDPSFTKLDLLCCRNLLIYFTPDLQKKLLPRFHYSLNPDGILFLGSSETIGQCTDLFKQLDKKWKIFQRRQGSSGSHMMFAGPAVPGGDPAAGTLASDTVKNAEQLSAFRLVETILKQSGAAPCVIIDSDLKIVYIHGRTGRFLEPAEGRVSIHLVEMARRGLKTELAAAIRKVSIHQQEVLCHGLRVEQEKGEIFLDLSVKPILGQSVMRGLLMVTFLETASPTSTKKRRTKQTGTKKTTKTVEELEQELRYSKESLQTTIEELETSNEELKSTNEELQSTNEELQSTNEEMETSKEELQSLNEESVTVNTELQSRIEELSKANDDLKNLLDSTEIATIFLDTDLNIRRFTPRATEIIPLEGTDCGRPIKHLASDLVEADLTGWSEQVLKDLVVREEVVRATGSRHFRVRIRPYRTSTNLIDGVVMTFDDVTKTMLAERAIHQTGSRLRAILENTPEAIYIVDREGTIQELNRAARGTTGEQVVGKTIFEVQPPVAPEITREALERVFQDGEVLNLGGITAGHDAKMPCHATRMAPIEDEEGVQAAILISAEVSEHRRMWEEAKGAAMAGLPEQEEQA